VSSWVSVRVCYPLMRDLRAQRELRECELCELHDLREQQEFRDLCDLHDQGDLRDLHDLHNLRDLRDLRPWAASVSCVHQLGPWPASVSCIHIWFIWKWYLLRLININSVGQRFVWHCRHVVAVQLCNLARIDCFMTLRVVLLLKWSGNFECSYPASVLFRIYQLQWLISVIKQVRFCKIRCCLFL